MFRIILVYTFFLITGCSATDKIYLCNGPTSVAYHRTKYCKGLRKCSSEIEVADRAQAKAKGRRACGYCY